MPAVTFPCQLNTLAVFSNVETSNALTGSPAVSLEDKKPLLSYSALLAVFLVAQLQVCCELLAEKSPPSQATWKATTTAHPVVCRLSARAVAKVNVKQGLRAALPSSEQVCLRQCVMKPGNPRCPEDPGSDCAFWLL